MKKLADGIPPISVEYIKELGLSFFEIYDPNIDSKDALDVSVKMSEYTSDGNELVLWLDLFNFYRSLPKSRLKSSIANIISEQFEDTVDNVIRNITFERGISQSYLFYIGSEYLKEYPEQQAGLFGFSFGGHTNQYAAKQLIEASKQYLGKQSWMALYFIYKQLPKENGTLSKSIRNLFLSHFNESIEVVAEKLDLDKVTEEDLKVSDTLPPELLLSQEAEAHLLTLQAEQLFKKREIGLNFVEELSVFWVNRSAYLKIVTTGGATVCVPVAAGIFLTANVYLLVSLGIALGGGLFVLELIGHTAFKIESMPTSALEALKGSHIALGMATNQVSKVAGQLAGQVNDLTGQNSSLKQQVGVLTAVNQAFMQTHGNQESLLAKMQEITSGTSETAAQLLLAESSLAQQNKALEQQVGRLTQQNSTMSDMIDRLQNVLEGLEDKDADLTSFAQLCREMMSSAGVQQSTTDTSHSSYVQAAQALYQQPVTCGQECDMSSF